MSGKIMAVNTGDFQKNFLKFVSTLSILSRRMAKLNPTAGTGSAIIIANMYKAFLQQGVGDNLAPLTRALINGDRPPLAALAKHVIVRPGTGSKNALVTYEKGWSRKASLLHTGYFMDMSGGKGNRIRRGLIRAGMDNVGVDKISDILDEHGSTAGIWVVPPRPHIDFLKRKETKAIIEAVYQNSVFGKPLPPVIRAAAKFRPSGVQTTPFIPTSATSATNVLDGVVL